MTSTTGKSNSIDPTPHTHTHAHTRERREGHISPDYSAFAQEFARVFANAWLRARQLALAVHNRIFFPYRSRVCVCVNETRGNSSAMGRTGHTHWGCRAHLVEGVPRGGAHENKVLYIRSACEHSHAITLFALQSASSSSSSSSTAARKVNSALATATRCVKVVRVCVCVCHWYPYARVKLQSNILSVFGGGGAKLVKFVPS